MGLEFIGGVLKIESKSSQRLWLAPKAMLDRVDGMGGKIKTLVHKPLNIGRNLAQAVRTIAPKAMLDTAEPAENISRPTQPMQPP
jgi:hypothetical protein